MNLNLDINYESLFSSSLVMIDVYVIFDFSNFWLDVVKAASELPGCPQHPIVLLHSNTKQIHQKLTESTAEF